MNQKSFLDRVFEAVRGKKVPPKETVGGPGFSIYGGYVSSPERSPKLSYGPKRFQTYSEMMANTAMVAAGVRYFLNIVSKPGWKVLPADDSGDEGKEIAELVEHMISDMVTPWHRVIRRQAHFRFMGFGVQEWTAKKRDKDGQIGMYDVESRPQHTITKWDCDETGSVHGVVQTRPQDSKEIYIPRSKLLYSVDDTLTDAPDGLGLLRHCFNASERLIQYEQLEAIGLGNDLRGIPIGRVPYRALKQEVADGKMTQQQADVLIQGMNDFIANHKKQSSAGLMLESEPFRASGDVQSPSNIQKWGLEIIKGDESGSLSDANRAIERLNHEIARILGVEHLMLGAGNGAAGSYAMSKDKTDQFALIVDTTLSDLVEDLSKDFIGPLMQLNGWGDELRPRFQVDRITNVEVEKVTAALRDMATAGATLDPNDAAICEVREMLGLSPPPSPEEMLLPPMSQEPVLDENGEPVIDELTGMPRMQNKPITQPPGKKPVDEGKKPGEQDTDDVPSEDGEEESDKDPKAKKPEKE